MPNGITRRSMTQLTVATAASMLHPAVRAQASKPSPRPYADTQAADAWMQTWIDAARPDGTKAPRNTLHLSRFADPMYFLTQEMGWDPNPGQKSYAPVRVPVGFVTDFASIPRAFWSALRPDGLYSYAAIVHDYLYWDQSLDRATADKVFKFVMQDFKISPVIINTLYTGVRLGGASAWSDNAKLKAHGERRLLKRFPDDPTLAWADWKTRPDVF